MKFKEIIYIVLVCIAIRACIEIFTVGGNYYGSLANQALMYLMMLLLVRYQGGGKNISIGKSVLPKSGRLSTFMYFEAILVAIILFSFSVGALGVSAFLVSLFDSDFAYSHYRFYDEDRLVHWILSARVLMYMGVNVLIAPYVEELVFRKKMIESGVCKSGRVSTALIVSCVFTMFHFGSSEYIGVFVFSFVLCLLYYKYQSVLVCATAHSAFNLIAFIHQYYFDTLWRRSADVMSDAAEWAPQISLFFVSTVAIAFYSNSAFFKLRKENKQGSKRIESRK